MLILRETLLSLNTDNGIQTHRANICLETVCGIYSLPRELLLSIFIKGMEDELGLEEPYVPCFRRMKTFASVIRSVCCYWRALIDDPVQTPFWIARSIVRMSDKRMMEDGRSSPFAKDLATLRAQLLTSKGCDLAVTFQAEIPSKPGQEVELRLMLHAFDMLAPYQSQIVQFRLEGPQTDVTIYFLEQITRHWKMAQRLLEIRFSHRRSLSGWRTVSELVNNSNIPHLGMLQHRRPARMSLPVSMGHLENLDLLEIPSASWLNGGLALPNTLRQLRISYVDVETIPLLHRYLSRNPLYQLRSMAVGHKETTRKTRRGPQAAWKVDGSPLILPHLLKLELHEAAKGHITAFIGCLFCPSLITVSLHWRVYWGQPPADPELTSTSPCPLLDNTSRVVSTHRNDGVTESQIIPLRSQFCPAHLFLQHAPYDDALLILFSTDTEHLEDLLLEVTDSDGQWHGETPRTLLGQQVSAPSLKNLEWLRPAEHWHILHFLANLSAPNLFSATIRPADENSRPAKDYFQDYPLAPFLSMKIIRYWLTAPFIPSNLMLSGVFPNLQQLHIDYMDHFPECADWGNFRSIFQGFIRSLCRPLEPTSEGYVPFPHLRLLDIECGCNRVVNLDPEGRKPAFLESEIRALLDDLLMNRMRLGALPLYKMEPVLSVSSYPLGGDPAEQELEKIVVRIRANSTPPKVDHERYHKL